VVKDFARICQYLNFNHISALCPRVTLYRIFREASMRLSPVAAVIISLCCRASAQSKTLAERLGYPRDSKLLIIHADDLAVSHSEDAASFDALDKQAATSASIMVPCPWLTEVAAYAKSHPDADLGLHLTLTAKWKTDRWGRVESKDKVPSLLDPDGYLWPEAGPALEHIKADEAEREIRAQSNTPSPWAFIPRT
jgi:hypothetical protein